MNIIKQIKTITVLGFFLGISAIGYTQEYPFFSDYGFNPYMVNSAYSGLLKLPQADINYNRIPTGTTGSPQTLSVSGVLPFHKNNFALGISLVSDRVGVTSFNTFKGSYAYRLKFSEDPKEDSYPQNELLDHSLSFGIEAGIRSINDDLLRLGMGSDPVLAQNVSTKVASVGASVMYNQTNFFIGVTAKNLLSKLSEGGNLLYVEHPVYVYTGYRFYIDKNHSMIITPNILVRHNFRTPVIVDYSVNMNFRGNFEVGVGYRDVGALSVGLGVRVFDNFRLMYVFNKYMRTNYFDNSNGVMVSYRPR